MTKKKFLAVALVAILAITAAVGASLAYLKDTKTVTNTFNAGKGNATGLTEPSTGGYLWAADVDMKGTPENTPNFVTSGETWNGLYFSDAQIETDAREYKNGYFKDHAENMVPGRNVRKNPYVKNTGSNDAYIRVRVLVPVSLFDVIDNGPSYWTSSALNEGQVTSAAVNAYNTEGPDTVKKVNRGDIQYYEYDFTFTKAVKPGELTFWNVWGNIAINKNATAEELAGVDSFDVIFEADAIQADGFAGAAAAFAAVDNQSINNLKGHSSCQKRR